MIKIIAIGDKMPFWIDSGIKHYLKQMQTVEIISIRSKKIDKIKEFEAQKLLKKTSGLIIALHEKGQQFSSCGFAKKFQDWQVKDISFIIGGADGLSTELIKNADFVLSLSKATMPHSLARLVLVEQIYRAQSIINNHPYHRD